MITGAKHTVVISEVISVCILTIAFIFAEHIVTAFGLGEEAVGYCTAHVRCVAFCLIPFAAYFPMLGLFQGANDALYATLVASSALAICVVLTYALQTIPDISYRMVWWNALFGCGLGFVITWTYFLRGKWKRKYILIMMKQCYSGTYNFEQGIYKTLLLFTRKNLWSTFHINA